MSDHPRTMVVSHPDGLELSVEDRGPLDAGVVISHHGSPSCRLDVPGGPGAASTTNTRIITFDRPGYAASDNRPGRTVADAAADAAVIADALGVERFATIGTSAGGPHALATAALLPDRVTALCVTVGLGPVEAEGFDVRDGLPDETIEEIACARESEEALRVFVEANGGDDGNLDVWMSQLPPSDRAVLARPEVASFEAAIEAEWLKGGIEGWIEDDLAFFARPWGFDLADIRVPTRLIYGDADVFVPSSHGVALASLIPHAELVMVPGGGHWLYKEQCEALPWLAASTGPPRILR